MIIVERSLLIELASEIVKLDEFVGGDHDTDRVDIMKRRAKIDAWLSDRLLPLGIKSHEYTDRTI